MQSANPKFQFTKFNRDLINYKYFKLKELF